MDNLDELGNPVGACAPIKVVPKIETPQPVTNDFDPQALAAGLFGLLVIGLVLCALAIYGAAYFIGGPLLVFVVFLVLQQNNK